MTNFESYFRELITIQVVSVLFTHINRKGAVSSIFNDNQSMFWYSHTGLNDLYAALDQLPIWSTLSQIESTKKSKLIKVKHTENKQIDVIFDVILTSLFHEKKQKDYLKSPLNYIETCDQLPIKLSGITELKNSEVSIGRLLKKNDIFPSFFQAKASISTRLKSLHTQIKKCNKKCNMLEIIELTKRYQSLLSLVSQELKKYDFYPQKHNLDDSKKLYALVNNLIDIGKPLIFLRVVISLSTILLLSYLEKQLTGTVSIEKKTNKKQKDILDEITGPEHFLESLHLELERCVEHVGKRIDTNHINYSLQQDYISFIQEKKGELLGMYKDGILLFFQKLYSNAFPFLHKGTLKSTISMLISSIEWEVFSDNLASLHLASLSSIQGLVTATPFLSIDFTKSHKEEFCAELSSLLNQERFILDIYTHFIAENRIVWVANSLKSLICKTPNPVMASLVKRFFQGFFLSLTPVVSKALLDELLMSSGSFERQRLGELVFSSFSLLTNKDIHSAESVTGGKNETSPQKWWNSVYFLNSWNSQFRKLTLSLSNLWWFQIFDRITSSQLQDKNLLTSFISYYKPQYLEKVIIDDYITYLNHRVINDHLSSYKHQLRLKNVSALFIQSKIDHPDLMSHHIQVQSFQSKIKDYWTIICTGQANGEQGNVHWLQYHIQKLAKYLAHLGHSESYLLLSCGLQTESIKEISDMFLTCIVNARPLSDLLLTSFQFLLYAQESQLFRFVKVTATSIKQHPQKQAILQFIEQEGLKSVSIKKKIYSALMYEITEQITYLETYEEPLNTRHFLEFDCVSPEALLSDFILSLFTYFGPQKIISNLGTLEKAELQERAQTFLLARHKLLALGLTKNNQHSFILLLRSFKKSKKVSSGILKELLEQESHSQIWSQLQYVIQLSFSHIQTINTIPPISIITAFVNRGVVFSPANVSPFKELFINYFNDTHYQREHWELGNHIVTQAQQMLKSPFQNESLDLVLLLLKHLQNQDFVITHTNATFDLEINTLNKCVEYAIKLISDPSLTEVLDRKNNVLDCLSKLVSQGKINNAVDQLSYLIEQIEMVKSLKKSLVTSIKNESDSMAQFFSMVCTFPRKEALNASEKNIIGDILKTKKELLPLLELENPRLFVQTVSFFSYIKPKIQNKADRVLCQKLSQTLFFILPEDLKDVELNDISFLTLYSQLFDHKVSPLQLLESLLTIKNYSQKRGLIYLCLTDFSLFKHFICHQENLLPTQVDHSLFAEKTALLNKVYKDACLSLSKTQNSKYSLIASQLFILIQELTLQKKYQHERLIQLSETVYEMSTHYLDFSESLSELKHVLNKTISLDLDDKKEVLTQAKTDTQLLHLVTVLKQGLSSLNPDPALQHILQTVLENLSRSALFVVVFYTHSYLLETSLITSLFSYLKTLSSQGNHLYKPVLDGQFSSLIECTQFFSVFSRLDSKDQSVYLPFLVKGINLFEQVDRSFLLPIQLHCFSIGISSKLLAEACVSFEQIESLVDELQVFCPEASTDLVRELPRRNRNFYQTKLISNDYSKNLKLLLTSSKKGPLKGCKKNLTQLITTTPEKCRQAIPNMFFTNKEIFSQVLSMLSEPVQSQFFEMLLNKKHPHYFSHPFLSHVLARDSYFQACLAKRSLTEFLTLNDININDVPVPFLTLELENNRALSLKDVSLTVLSTWLHYLISYHMVEPMLSLIEQEKDCLTKLIYKIFFDSQTEFFMLKTDDLIRLLSYISEETLTSCFQDLKKKYKVSETALFNTFIANTSLLTLNKNHYSYLSRFFELFGETIESSEFSGNSSDIRYIFSLYQLNKAFDLSAGQLVGQLSRLQFLPGTLHTKHVEELAKAFQRAELVPLLKDLAENKPYVFKSLLLHPAITASIYQFHLRGGFTKKQPLYQLIMSSFGQFYSAESYQFLSQYVPFKSKKERRNFTSTLDKLLSLKPLPSAEEAFSSLTKVLGPSLKKFDPGKDPFVIKQIKQLFSEENESSISSFFSDLKPNSENQHLLSVAQLMQIESKMELLISNDSTRWLFFSYLSRQLSTCWTPEFDLFTSGWESQSSLIDSLQLQLNAPREKLSFQNLINALKVSLLEKPLKDLSHSTEKHIDVFLFLYSRNVIEKREFLKLFIEKLSDNLDQELALVVPRLIDNHYLSSSDKLFVFKTLISRCDSSLCLELLETLRKSHYFIPLWKSYLHSKDPKALMSEDFVSGTNFDDFIINQIKSYLKTNSLVIVDFLGTESEDLQHYFAHCLYTAYESMDHDPVLKEIHVPQDRLESLRSAVKVSLSQNNKSFLILFSHFLNRHLAYHKKPIPWLFQLIKDTGRVVVKKDLPTYDSIQISKIKSDNKSLHPVAVLKYLLDANYVDYQGIITHHIRTTTQLKLPKLAKQISQSHYQHFVTQFSDFLTSKLENQALFIEVLLDHCPALFFETNIKKTKKSKASYFKMVSSKLVPHLVSSSPSAGIERLIDDIVLSIHNKKEHHVLLIDGLKTLSLNEMFLLLFSDKRLFNCRLLLLNYLFKSPTDQKRLDYKDWRTDLAKVFVKEMAVMVDKSELNLAKRSLFLDVLHSIFAVSSELFYPIMSEYKDIFEKKLNFDIDRLKTASARLNTFQKKFPVQTLIPMDKISPFLISLVQLGVPVLDTFTSAASLIPLHSDALYHYKQFLHDRLNSHFKPLGLSSLPLQCLSLLLPGLPIGKLSTDYFLNQFHGITLKQILYSEKIIDKNGVILITSQSRIIEALSKIEHDDYFLKLYKKRYPIPFKEDQYGSHKNDFVTTVSNSIQARQEFQGINLGEFQLLLSRLLPSYSIYHKQMEYRVLKDINEAIETYDVKKLLNPQLQTFISSLFFQESTLFEKSDDTYFARHFVSHVNLQFSINDLAPLVKLFQNQDELTDLLIDNKVLTSNYFLINKSIYQDQPKLKSISVDVTKKIYLHLYKVLESKRGIIYSVLNIQHRLFMIFQSPNQAWKRHFSALFSDSSEDNWALLNHVLGKKPGESGLTLKHILLRLISRKTSVKLSDITKETTLKLIQHLRIEDVEATAKRRESLMALEKEDALLNPEKLSRSINALSKLI